MTVYDSLKEIPAHIFLNMNCTKPATEEFARYLAFLSEYDENALKYIFTYSQQYVNHGGAAKTSFPRWLVSLRSNLRIGGYLDGSTK